MNINQELGPNESKMPVEFVGDETRVNIKKAPGVPARKTGKRLKRGRALQLMVYPRAAAKSAIVEGARRARKSMSSFCILASLQAAARVLGCSITDLGVSEAELKNYR